MSIYKYNILNPVTDKHKPHYVEKGNWFIFSTAKRYRYYVEVSKLNDRGITEYYLLLSEKNLMKIVVFVIIVFITVIKFTQEEN